MIPEPTRFFCRCGRLLTAEQTGEQLLCPTCSRKVTAPDPRDAASASGTQLLTPRAGSRVGRYRVEAALGSGGMGSVYRAVDETTGEAVALKLLHPSLQAREDFVSRFRREARAAAALEHPNVVKVLDYGVDSIGPWIAMELLEGEDLLRAEGLDESAHLELMRQAALGLRAAAAQGITHRDVKPTNLILQLDGTLKIADFGLAKAADTDSQLTMTGEVLGTPHYMSPEQGRGQAVDLRSDLYSLGATFYHLAAGDPPFTADTPVAVIMKHLGEEPVALRRRSPSVSAGFEAVVHRLLRKAPSERYASYDQLLTDLHRLQAGREPLHGATPPERAVQQGATTYLLPQEARTELLLRPASLVRRAVALALDLVLLELIFLLLGQLWSSFVGEGGAMPSLQDAWYGRPAKLHPLLAAVVLALPVAFFVASDSRGGRSFGRA